MTLTPRDCAVIIFALNYLRSNMDHVMEMYSETGVHPTITLPNENELDNTIAKLERIDE